MVFFKKLPKKIKKGVYVINLDEYADVGTHWIALFCNRNETVYFDSFGVENVPEEIPEEFSIVLKIKDLMLIFLNANLEQKLRNIIMQAEILIMKKVDN